MASSILDLCGFSGLHHGDFLMNENRKFGGKRLVTFNSNVEILS